MEVLPLLWCRTGEEVVEYMEIALPRRRAHDAGSLKVVRERLDAAQTPARSELQLDVLTNAGGVRVMGCAGVCEGFEDEVGGGGFESELCVLLSGGGGEAELDEGSGGEASVLGFSAACLTPGMDEFSRCRDAIKWERLPEYEALIPGRPPHMEVGIARQLMYVRREDFLALADIVVRYNITLQDRIWVRGYVFVWIECDKPPGTNVGVDII